MINIKLHLATIIPSYKRFMEFININQNKNYLIEDQSVDIVKNIKINNLSYSINNEKIFDSLNIELISGDKVAIIGRNGIGKSSIVLLLQRFLNPEYGKILIKNIVIKRIKKNSLMNCIGVVNQDYYIFNSSVKDNIILKRDYDKSFYEEMMKVLNICTDERRCVGYDGSNLSGGQRQKISIARAIALKKSLYIFDEFERNLDASSQIDIMNFILEHFNQCINIFVTHNDDIIEKCNIVIEIISNSKYKITRK